MYIHATVKNPSIVKRFSHTQRFHLALKLLNINHNDIVLDYGTCDGFMVNLMLSQSVPPKLIVGYEPISKYFAILKNSVKEISGKVLLINTPDQFKHIKFTKICCLEIFEHLQKEKQLEILLSIKKLLTDTGIIIVSVPIETGFSSLIKNLIRFFLRQSHPNASGINIFKSCFGIPIDRKNHDFYPTHIGFDYRELEMLFSKCGLEIREKLYSPFKILNRFCNSQVFYILVPR